MESLTDLKRGEKAIILGFSTEDIPAKFLELGLIPGTNVELKASAPFNGPICIALCKTNCKLALRRAEANEVLIKRIA